MFSYSSCFAAALCGPSIRNLLENNVLTKSESEARVKRDLKWAFSYFDMAQLLCLRENLDRLSSSAYVNRATGRGCIFGLLTWKQSADEQIDRRQRLTKWFTGGNGYPYRELPCYQPARYIVRLFDAEPQERYGNLTGLSRALLAQVLEEVLAERRAIEAASRREEMAAKRRGTAHPPALKESGDA